MNGPAPVRRKTVTALVLGGVIVLSLFRLGAVGFFDPDEGRYAAIPTAMLRTGDFVVPHLGGFPYLEKPPLLYWLTAASLKVLGKSEFAARLPVAAAGILGVWALFELARRTRGLRTALLAAGLLALNTQWFVQARFLTTDMILAGSMTAAFCLFYFAFVSDRRAFYLLFYVAIALATLSKGFIGFVLPGLVVICFIVATRRWRLLREMHLIPGALIFAAIVLPWFVLVQRRFPEFLKFFVVDQHLDRFVQEQAQHARPFWFFVPVVVAGFFPWIVHLPFVGRFRPPADRPPGAPAVAEAGVPARRSEGGVLHGPLQLFLWLWFGAIFVFFSASSGKLISYILPALPPLALMVAELFSRLWDPAEAAAAARRVRAASLVVGVIWVSMAPVSLLGLRWLVIRDGRLRFEDVSHWPWAFAVVWGAGGVALLAVALAHRARAAVAVQSVATVALFLVMMGAAAAVEPYMNPRPLGLALARVAKPDDLVALYRIPEPSFEYYLGRPPMLIAFTGEYEFGIKLAPDPQLFQNDPAALWRLFETGKTVYFLADQDDAALPKKLPPAVQIEAQNVKRVLYRFVPPR